MYGRHPFALTPWVKRLLVANAVVYLLTITVFWGPGFLDLVAFTPARALRQPWTFVTYMFVHGGFLHLGFNMLMLFFFGSAVENRMGERAFLRFYLFCGLGGAILSFVINVVGPPVDGFIGASAAVFGVALAFAIFWPDAPVYVFPLPVPIKVKWLVLGLASIDLLMALSQAENGVANLAHLGGFLFGLIYLKGVPRLREGSQSVAVDLRPSYPPTAREPDLHALVHSRTRTGEADAEGNGPPGPANRLDEIDRLLDKISESGIESLTPEERRALVDRSEYLRDH